MDPFLDLAAFQGLWDGPPLTAQQKNIVTLLLGVASKWIYNHSPGIAQDDASAKFVVYDVVSTAVRYQKYSKLSTFNKVTGHRVDGGTFTDPMKALEFTDTHKQLLGIPLTATAVSQFFDDDFADPTRSGWQTSWQSGWPTVSDGCE